MTWVRRGRLLVGVLLACLSIPLLGGQAAWAHHYTWPEAASATGWSMVSVASESFVYDRPAQGTEPTRYMTTLCVSSDYATTQFVHNAVAIGTGAGPVTQAYSCGGSGLTLQAAYWRAESTTGPVLFVWRTTGYQGHIFGSGGSSPSPSPYPSPVITPSPYPVPGPTETWYAYPTPQVGGGGDVDGCAVDTCTVTLAAGSEVGLSPSQWTVLCLFLAVMLIVGLSGFVVRHSRPWRVGS